MQLLHYIILGYVYTPELARLFRCDLHHQMETFLIVRALLNPARLRDNRAHPTSSVYEKYYNIRLLTSLLFLLLLSLLYNIIMIRRNGSQTWWSRRRQLYYYNRNSCQVVFARADASCRARTCNNMCMRECVLYV